MPEPGPGDELEWSRDGKVKRAPRAAPKPLIRHVPDVSAKGSTDLRATP